MKKILLVVVTLTAVTACKIGSRSANDNGTSGSGLAEVKVGDPQSKLEGKWKDNVNKSDVLSKTRMSLQVIKKGETTVPNQYLATLKDGAFKFPEIKLKNNENYSFLLSIDYIADPSKPVTLFRTNGKEGYVDKQIQGKENPTTKKIEAVIQLTLCMEKGGEQFFKEIGACIAIDPKDPSGTDVLFDTDFEKAKSELSSTIDVVLKKISANVTKEGKDTAVALGTIQFNANEIEGKEKMDASDPKCLALGNDLTVVDDNKDAIVLQANEVDKVEIKTKLERISVLVTSLRTNKCNG